MAAKDAEMPDHKALSEDIEEITKHLASLRQDIDKITGSFARAGSHQVERAQDAAQDALAAVENAVKRDPVSTLGIALGVGLLLGIIIRR